MAHAQGGGDTVTLNDVQRSQLPLSGAQTQVATPNTGVDVSRAEYDFFALSRQLSRRSNIAAWDNPSASTVNATDDPYNTTAQPAAAVDEKSKDVEKDIEKGSAEVESDRFDLREYLASSNDAYQEAGIKHKHVGVTWEDLHVGAASGGGNKVYAMNFGTALLDLLYTPFKLFNVIQPSSGGLKTILHKSSGVLKPGEMCLVLGCPGSGCTTFLKAITNQRDGYRIAGDVLYAGMSSDEMAKYYQGEVCYNEEDDVHIPTLTVAQTLNFALSLKAPGPNGRLPNVSNGEFRQEVLDLLLRMLNIRHTRNTLVGDEFVRGVSGGERKRVSIAEMMATRARVQSWDNSTRGLDASTALDFAKCLRIMTDVLGQTTFVSLYQAGEGIYELFDKVLVMDEGRQVYFGPPSEARAYFENLGYNSLPRQSTADYLTGCTDPNERQFSPGRSANDVPSTPEALEEAFLKSPYAHDVREDLESYKVRMETEKVDQEVFRAAVVDDKKKGVSKKSPYTIGFWSQVKALTIRQFQMKLQDRFQLYTSYTLSIILAFMIGGGYFDQPLTSNGAFTRGSVLFITIMTPCLDGLGEMPLQMLGRPIMRRQVAYRLYRPSAVSVANTLADMPFTALRILIFNIIVYFMSHLHWSAGGFFTFHLLIYLAFLTIQGLFRTLGLFCRNFDTAFRVSTFFLPNFVQYLGYMLPVFEMKRWLFWIYYINPLSYAWQGCMENEFMRIDFTCDEMSTVPRNIPGVVDKYPTELGPNQVCTLFGAEPGSNMISGRTYLDVAFGLKVSDRWVRCFLVLLGCFVLFQCTQLLVLEFFPQYKSSTSTSAYVKESSEEKKLNERLRQRRKDKLEKGHTSEASSHTNISPVSSTEQGSKQVSTKSDSDVWRKTFTWENLNYHVPTAEGPRLLLHDVFGYVKPGTLTALMGASGAGKTTCLDVLAQRKNIGVVSGDILVDGRPLTSDFARGTAYAEQMDVHEGTATIREAMRFSAYLRQPASVSRQEKDDYVEEMIELLELQELANALVSSLSVEARKRLTIGVELASKPELLLFLDEPTSGLDAQSAWNLVRFLRKLADQGQAILCTIHQPSSLLFESFDRLLLLERGGETVYFGDIGPDSRVLRDYFARYGAVCPSNVNPAEYMLEAIGAGVTPRVGPRDWKDIWLDSPEFANVKMDIEKIKAKGLARPEETAKSSYYATSMAYQLQVVVKRNSIALWRSPDYLITRLFISGLVSLLISLSFLQLGNSLRDLQYRVFAIFWVGILPMIILNSIEPLFIHNRRIFIRESSSRIYSPYVFAFGQLIGEVPYNILAGILYWVLMVWPIGFGQGIDGLNANGFQLLTIIFLILFAVSLGQLIAAISPSVQVAVLFNPVIGLMFNTFCGVTIPYPTLISFWRSWLYELSPYTRLIASMVSTELHGLDVVCKDSEFYHFDPPSGQTCYQWANDYVSNVGGYLANPNATSSCDYCQYSVGDEYFEPLNIQYENRWRDSFLLLAFFAFNFAITIIASRFFRFAKR